MNRTFLFSLAVSTIADVAGLDPGRLRAIAVVAGPAPGEYRSELGSTTLD